VGRRGLDANTTGANNIAIGEDALGANTTASYNTAVGYQAGYSNTTGTPVDAFGYQALESNTTGINNAAFGYQALLENTTGTRNNAFGRGALAFNTTGASNTSMGVVSLNSNTTGSYNTAIGDAALVYNTTASNNTALGYQAGYLNATGAANVFLGYRAGYLGVSSPANTILGFRAGENNTSTNGYNTFVGNYAGYSNTSGYNNTFIGARTGGLAAGYYVTTGSKNTIIGGYDGNQGNLDIRTSSNHIVLSDGDGNPRLWMKDGGYIRAVGNTTVYNADNTHQFGNAEGGSDYVVNIFSKDDGSGTGYPLALYYAGYAPDDNNSRYLTCSDSGGSRLFIYSDGDVVNHDNSYGSLSDVKLKEQITDASSQWDDIKALTVRKYKMKSDVAEKGDSDDLWRLGVVAQEVEAAGMSGLVSESPDRDANNNDLGTTTKEVKYSILYMKAVKALQEAMDRIETLEAKVQALETN